MLPLQFLERHFGSYETHRHEALFTCPFCQHHKRKLSVNVEKGFWKCWVCDARGRSLFGLVWKHGDAAIVRAYRAAFPNNIEVESDDEPVPKDFELELPEEYVPLCTDRKSFDAGRARNYLRRRGVTEQHILTHKIGFATWGRYRDRVILPSFDAEGRLNFYTGRSFIGEPYKYLNPETPQGYKKTIVLNELNVDWLKPIYIVEGFMDMLKMDNSIPLFGSTLPYDSKLLLNLVLNDSKVYCCLDSDAYVKQIRLMKTLSSYGVSCYSLDVYPYKDVAEMPDELLAQRQAEADGHDRISMLRNRIRNL